MRSTSASAQDARQGRQAAASASSLGLALAAARQYAEALRGRQSRDHLYGLLLFCLTFTLLGLIAYLVSKVR